VNDTPAIQLGNLVVTTPTTQARRMSILLWGDSGLGKTTLATTMPGKKLWINFDPDGTASVPDDGNTLIADFSSLSAKDLINKFTKEDTVSGSLLWLSKFIKDQNIESIIVDSVTLYSDKALAHGITLFSGGTIEAPTERGWGFRTSFTMQMINNINKVAMEHDCHIMFISHESEKTKKDREGKDLPTEHFVMLGGSLKTLTTIRLSEVWSMTKETSGRKIWIQAMSTRKPMKTRMFNTLQGNSFVWKYDPENPDNPINVGMRISDWFDAWVKNNGKKIDQPKLTTDKK
jgi:hypothetical protein